MDEAVANFIIKVMGSSRSFNKVFNFVSMAFIMVRFLSGEGVTIFEGDRRRDSDSFTHP